MNQEIPNEFMSDEETKNLFKKYTTGLLMSPPYESQNTDVIIEMLINQNNRLLTLIEKIATKN